AGQPVDHVDAELEVPAVAEKLIAQEMAVADYHDALRAVADRAFERGGYPDRARHVARLVECDGPVELAHLDPAARRDVDQARHFPLAAFAALLIDADLAREREDRVEAELIRDRVAAVAR